GQCSALVSAEREEAETLSELLAALEAYKPLSKRIKLLAEFAEELAATKAELIGQVAAALVAPHAAALKALVSDYVEEYSASKTALGTLDFDDLQVKVVELLERRPEIAMRYREQFRVVMIDEFQDTDALQLRLVEALSDGDLCTVGDEKQSIYRFRGADISVYRAHRERMERQGALVAELDVNYRSHGDILGFVNEVFSSAEYFGDTLLKLQAPPGPRVGTLDAALGAAPRVEAAFIDSTDADGAGARAAEAATIAARLAELCEAGAAPRDIAVLVRTYTHAHDYANALTAVGIRAVVIGGSRFFRLPETSIMRALNRVVANVEDGVALGELLASDFIPISSDALAVLRLGSGERDRRSLWALLTEADTRLTGADAQAAERLVGVLERARERVGRLPLRDVLLLAVEESGWDLRLLAGGNVGRDAFANVLKFARQAAAFEDSVGSGPTGFAAHLDTKERLGDTEAPASLADDGSDAVRIMSIHASKGLEFPIVVVPGLAAPRPADRLAVRASRRGGGLAVALRTPANDDGDSRGSSTWFAEFSDADAQAELEESARVLYVACTRARELLLVTGSMGMRPAKGTSAKYDLARLSRVLGVTIPTVGPSDGIVTLAGAGTRCRVRVIDAGELAGAALPIEAESAPGTMILPPAGRGIPEEPQRALAPERLSYTQLSEFEHCPRAFWVRRVLGVRPMRIPMPGQTDPLLFGTALHAALRLVGADGAPPSSERVSAIGRFYELSNLDVVRLGQAVRRYCESDVAHHAVAGETVRRESPFAMNIGDKFLLTGSIDLYSRTADRALVVDYKSGGTGVAADLRTRYQLQAECYALAVLRDGCNHATVEFVRPEVEPDEDGDVQRVAFEFSAADRETIERDLLRRYGEIEASAFEPAPSRECYHCEVPRGLCPERTRPDNLG
ncbi:MAG: UvrD-helicase domain-containing protein, partial [Coriobacteriia bacterium]|nr:UvrD-helicase domain-containing protein [Coriobacteriia bacterium]